MNNVEQYISNSSVLSPFFINGDAFSLLKNLPNESIDCIITSPPYYHKRKYLEGNLGLEKNYTEYIENILNITKELYRVLKPSGSFWLNLGDSYLDKNLLNIPYRIAIKMQDEQKWILRNTVIWDKMKGSLSFSKDSLRNEYEPFFHFVKYRKGYFYDDVAIRKKPGKAVIKDNKVISATGVKGINYRRKIELSTELTEEQKKNAFLALDENLNKIKRGELTDFRMVIKGANQRITFGESLSLSGRAKELNDNGFYFLNYNPNGSMISDVWQITSENKKGNKVHYAIFPEDLVKTPILLTCPTNGIVLDPFVGSGTTSYVSSLLKRKSIGIDISEEYIKLAIHRCSEFKPIIYEDDKS